MAAVDLAGLNRSISAGEKAQTYLLYSPDEYLLDSFARRLSGLLLEEGEEPTVLPGPVPDIGQAVAAAGAISLFGTKRLVYLSRIEPTAMRADDIKLLAELMQEAENATLLLTMIV